MSPCSLTFQFNRTTSSSTPKIETSRCGVCTGKCASNTIGRLHSDKEYVVSRCLAASLKYLFPRAPCPSPSCADRKRHSVPLASHSSSGELYLDCYLSSFSTCCKFFGSSTTLPRCCNVIMNVCLLNERLISNQDRFY